MRAWWFVGLALVACVGGTPLKLPWPKPNVNINYHRDVGFKLAADIKAAEDRYMNDLNNNYNDSRIVGGAVAPANSYPFLGGLVISYATTSGVSVCGSSLVTANRLVSAAHCWFDGTWQAMQFEVVLGSQMVFYGGTRIATNQIVTHPQYIFNWLWNDVAVIYLPTSVFFTQAIQPVALPSGTQLWDTFAGHWAIAAGFGLTSDQETGVSLTAEVRHVSLQVITVAECQARWGTTWVLQSTLCTSGTGSVGICRGDSGGPLVVNQNGQLVLVGISSFVDGNGCQLGSPSGFARVTTFTSWFMQHLW